MLFLSGLKLNKGKQCLGNQYKINAIFILKSHQIKKTNLLTFKLNQKKTNLKMFGYGYGGYGLGGFGGYGGYGWC